MSKFKDILPNLFGINKNSQKTKNGKLAGRLETDALPVDDNSNENPTTTSAGQSINNSLEIMPTDSGIYDSMSSSSSALTPLASPSSIDSPTGVSGAVVVAGGNDGELSMPQNGPTVNNTVQQQVVMQISNVNKLHFGSVYNINSNLNATASGTATNSRKSSMEEIGATGSSTNTTTFESGKRQQTLRKTTSVVVMMQSQEEPNHPMIDAIATHLGEGWKLVMRELGHSEGQIEQALIDHQMHGGIKEVIYQLLLQWVRNADDGVATLGNITTILWELNHRDCVQRMKRVWKSDLNRKTSR